jgi:hypothetical protein
MNMNARDFAEPVLVREFEWVGHGFPSSKTKIFRTRQARREKSKPPEKCSSARPSCAPLQLSTARWQKNSKKVLNPELYALTRGVENGEDSGEAAHRFRN